MVLLIELATIHIMICSIWIPLAFSAWILPFDVKLNESQLASVTRLQQCVGATLKVVELAKIGPVLTFFTCKVLNKIPQKVDTEVQNVMITTLFGMEISIWTLPTMHWVFLHIEGSQFVQIAIT